MNRRLVISILTCAAIVFACAPRNRVTATEQSSPQQQSVSVVQGIAYSLVESSDAQSMSFALEVTNNGKRTEVRFPSGHTHDFIVVDGRDREVWRWSSGRLFTQALQTKQLKTGDGIRYEATWEEPAPGTYRVIASLNSATHPQKLEREFTVR